MSETPFSLKRFIIPSPENPITGGGFEPDFFAAYTIQGTIASQANGLDILYFLKGPVSHLEIPERVGNPARTWNLWEKTCFEFFLALPNSPQYLEFNLSPSGQWNVFRFQDYRKGMQEEKTFSALPFHFQQEAHGARLSIHLDLPTLAVAGRPVKAAISTVLKSIYGEFSYWALSHPAPQADFHHRNSFVIAL